MSVRHTRTGALANQLHDGTCLVPSMGWFGSIMPGGRHRRRECESCGGDADVPVVQVEEDHPPGYWLCNGCAGKA